MHRKTVYVYSEEVHKNINKKIRNFLDHLRALNLEIKYEGVRNKLDIQKFGTLQADMQCFIVTTQVSKSRAHRSWRMRLFIEGRRTG